jgi:hypothetical protein
LENESHHYDKFQNKQDNPFLMKKKAIIRYRNFFKRKKNKEERLKVFFQIFLSAKVFHKYVSNLIEIKNRLKRSTNSSRLDVGFLRKEIRSTVHVRKKKYEFKHT